MFVILTSKPGQFHTELVDGLRPVATYDYILCGQTKATFVIAECEPGIRLRIVDEATPPVISDVPSKFLSKYPSIDQAVAELQLRT
jgi:hypothetical protein